jgi:hypothetical protein
MVYNTSPPVRPYTCTTVGSHHLVYYIVQVSAAAAHPAVA